MDAMLSRFPREYAMNNREEIDGFFAALIWEDLRRVGY
jgi:hypothetical protein